MPLSKTFHYPRITIICAALLSLFTLTAPSGSAWAASSASSASSAVSDSIGSSSTSLERSSKSSSDDRRVAQGTYTVIETVALADEPTMLELQLQRESQQLRLKLPRAAAERAGIVVGSMVHVAHRPYGTAFSAGATETAPFFLVLDDDWYQELRTHAVVL